MSDWQQLEAELKTWRSTSLELPIWWRDDDAVSPTAAFDAMQNRSEALGIAVHIAVIPALARPALATRIKGVAQFVPVVHGWSHKNHAATDQKKSEFGTPRAQARLEAAQGIATLNALFDGQVMPIFVPPWNRVDPDLLPVLPNLGYRAVSTFTPRKAKEAARHLIQINTHVDPIFWRGGGGLLDPEQQIQSLITQLRNRREGHADLLEPLGILTHHLVQDAETWQFTERCLKTLLDGGARVADLGLLLS